MLSRETERKLNRLQDEADAGDALAVELLGMLDAGERLQRPTGAFGIDGDHGSGQPGRRDPLNVPETAQLEEEPMAP